MLEKFYSIPEEEVKKVFPDFVKLLDETMEDEKTYYLDDGVNKLKIKDNHDIVELLETSPIHLNLEDLYKPFIIK